MAILKAGMGAAGGGVGAAIEGLGGPLVNQVLTPFTQGVKEGVEPALNLVGDVLDVAKELNPIEEIQSKLLKERTPEQHAAEVYNSGSKGKKKMYVKPIRVAGTNEYWDLLYDEPCWIDPDSGTFDLATAFGKLWTQWYNIGDPIDKVKDEIGQTSSTSIDTEKLRGAFYELKAEAKKADIPEGAQKTFDDAVDDWVGETTETADPTPTSDVPVTDPDPKKDTTKKKDDDALFEALGIPIDRKDEFVTVEENIAESLLSGNWASLISPGNINNPSSTDGDTSPKVEGKTSKSKWFFCFFIKFLMGPVGYMLLRIMPYFMRFIYTIMDSGQKLFYILGSGLPTSLGRPIPYTSKNGQGRVKYVKSHHAVYSYFGLVIPLGLIKYDWGKVYGNGEFGKFILSLTLLSAGLIIMGGISIFVFLIVFAIYFKFWKF